MAERGRCWGFCWEIGTGLLAKVSGSRFLFSEGQACELGNK